MFKNEKHVTFRFKSKTNFSPFGDGNSYGFRLDNFKIDALIVDYVAQDTIQLATNKIGKDSITLNLKVLNNGQTNGMPTTTYFYASLDSILDLNDTLIYQFPLEPILKGETKNKKIRVPLLSKHFQDSIYCFAHIDGNNSMIESNENNNFIRYKIKFLPYVNYQVISKIDTVTITSTKTPINMDYSIWNNGSLDGKNTVTTFYWSKDTIFDSTDKLIAQNKESFILSMDTLTKNIKLTIPLPVIEKYYYVVYKADDLDSLIESNEQDNLEFLRVGFNLGISINEIIIEDLLIYSNYENLLINSKIKKSTPFSISIYGSDGKLIHQIMDQISPGLNNFKLPNIISSGIYFIHLQSEKQSKTGKLFIRRN